MKAIINRVRAHTSVISLMLMVMALLIGCSENGSLTGADRDQAAGSGNLWMSSLDQRMLPIEPDPYPLPSTAMRDIRMDNIAAVRDIITNTISGQDWGTLTTALVAVQDHYRSHLNATGQPPGSLAPEADIIHQIFLGYAPGLESQVLDLIQGDGTGDLGAAAADKQEEDEDPIDAWTLVHYQSGSMLGVLDTGFFTTLGILILWEVIEPHIWPGWHESPENQIVDVIAGMLGWFMH